MAKGLLFDFDGTLYGDWRIWISIITETLADFHVSVDPDDALKKAREMIKNESGSRSTLRISSVAARIARDRGLDQDEEIRARFFQILDSLMDKTGPDKNLGMMLESLQRDGFRLGIVTFVRKPRITRRLDVWELNRYFQSVVTPDDVPDFKPSPQPFQTAMGQLQVQPSECYVIGDEPVDMVGGKGAGAKTIGFPQGFFTRQELEMAGADYILTSLKQLPNVITN